MGRKGLSKETRELLTEQVIEYRQAKVSYRQIAKKVGISKSEVYRLVHRAMNLVKKNYMENASHIVIMEMANLDMAESALHNRIVKGDTQAIATVLRIQERRSRLIGLDAPVKQHIEMDLPEPIQFVYKE